MTFWRIRLAFVVWVEDALHSCFFEQEQNQKVGNKT